MSSFRKRWRKLCSSVGSLRSFICARGGRRGAARSAAAQGEAQGGKGAERGKRRAARNHSNRAPGRKPHLDHVVVDLERRLVQRDAVGGLLGVDLHGLQVACEGRIEWPREERRAVSAATKSQHCVTLFTPRTLPSSNVNEPASPILNVLLHLPGRYMSVLRERGRGRGRLAAVARGAARHGARGGAACAGGRAHARCVRELPRAAPPARAQSL